jgi:putative transcription antitermination factor YqgF
MSPYLENRENILGVDYGETNTGFAISVDGVPSPLKVVNSKNLSHLLQEMSTVIVRYKIKLIVFGLPLNLDNQDTPQSMKVRQVVNYIKKFIKTPIVYVSEFGSTSSTLSSGIMTHASRKSRNKENDARSACFILQNYLDETYKPKI